MRNVVGNIEKLEILILESPTPDNLCTPFKYDIRCASLCGVEFVVTKERREKRAQRESYLKGVQRLLSKRSIERFSTQCDIGKSGVVCGKQKFLSYLSCSIFKIDILVFR